MDIEKRSATDIKAEGRKLVGYAAVFGAETRIADFREAIAPGAFSASLASGKDILALQDHDSGKVLARTKSGTLRLSEDTRGLRFEIDMPDTQLGRDLLTMAERGDVGGMSFGFHVREGGESWQGDRRELRSVELHEISVVQSFPAYPQTSVSARSRMTPDGAASRARTLILLELEGVTHGIA